MTNKNRKIALVLVIAAAVNTLFVPAAQAQGNSYTVRIACVIPAVPGKNVPIVQEVKASSVNVQTSRNLVLQKDALETRIIDGNRTETQVQTFYNR
jgi:hypothetical protein